MATTLGHQRSKTPSSGLAGPYGHPFHPMFVVIPIGAWLASFVFDIVSLNAEDSAAFAKGSALLLAIGIAGAVIAAVFGLMDYLQLPRRTKAMRTATTHMILNLGVTVAFVASLLARAQRDFDDVPAGLVVLSGVALLVLSVSGWLGGRLAYHFGIRVADEQTQAEAFVETDVVPETVSGALRDESNRYRSKP